MDLLTQYALVALALLLALWFFDLLPVPPRFATPPKPWGIFDEHGVLWNRDSSGLQTGVPPGMMTTYPDADNTYFLPIQLMQPAVYTVCHAFKVSRRLPEHRQPHGPHHLLPPSTTFYRQPHGPHHSRGRAEEPKSSPPSTTFYHLLEPSTLSSPRASRRAAH